MGTALRSASGEILAAAELLMVAPVSKTARSATTRLRVNTSRLSRKWIWARSSVKHLSAAFRLWGSKAEVLPPDNSGRHPPSITRRLICASKAIPCDPTFMTPMFSAAIGTPNIRARGMRGLAGGVWSTPGWTDINNWLGQHWETSNCMYGIDLIYKNNMYYLDGRPYANADAYYKSAANIAQIGEQANIPSEPPATSKQSDSTTASWLPLGVFEAIPSAAKTSNMMFQLVVNKAGIIRGNYFDTADNNVQLIEGSIGMDMGRAAWIVADKKNIVFDCMIYNLSKAETTVLVHSGNDKNEQWTFVRLTQDPKAVAKQ